jgi:ubiquinone/menaquinone biosynthesis C-methylase UbiE
MRLDPVEWSAVYDAPRPSGHEFAFRHGAELALTASLARAEPGEHWVDVGAGPGHLAARLAAEGLEVSAVDDDRAMVDAARERFGSTNGSNALEFVTARAEELPFAGGSVDGVVATALVGLLPDPRPFLSEVGRVLRPGGAAVITFSNRSSPLHGVEMMIRTRGPGRHARKYAAAARRYRRREAERKLERAGLELERAYYFNFFVSAGRWAWPPRRLALFLEPRIQSWGGVLVARNLLTVARKERGVE